jgi:hypothetical protein
MRRHRAAVIATVAVAAGLVVSACQSSDTGPSAVATPVATVAASLSPSASPTAGSDGAPPATEPPSGDGTPTTSLFLPPTTATPTVALGTPAGPPALVTSPAAFAVSPGAMAARSIFPAVTCAPGRLRWTLTRLSDTPVADGSPVARLTAVNTSPAACVFDGYPWFRVHVGRAAEAVAEPGPDQARPLTLAPGRAVDIDLRYRELPDPATGCLMPAASRPQAQALPPNAAPTATRVAVALTDTHGHPVPLTVCTADIRMAAPVLR